MLIRVTDRRTGLYTFRKFNNTDEALIAAGKSRNPFLYCLELDKGHYVKIGYSSNIHRRIIDHRNLTFRNMIGRVALLEFDGGLAKNVKAIESWIHRILNSRAITIGKFCGSEYETYIFDKDVTHEPNNFDAFINNIFITMIMMYANGELEDR